MAQKNSQNLTVYLGSGDERARRLERIRALALKYVGVDRRSHEPAVSTFIQKIIDGDLIVIDPDEYRHKEIDPNAA